MCPEFAIIAPLRHYREVFEVHTTWPVHMKKSKEGWEAEGEEGWGGGGVLRGGGGGGGGGEDNDNKNHDGKKS